MKLLSQLVILSLSALEGVHAARVYTGKSFTGWDCCKPGCAWQVNLRGVNGQPKVCDINNNPLGNGLNAKSGCESGGNAFLCGDYSPTPVANNQSYGFALAYSVDSCCRCYELTWTSGAATGKSMTVQIINAADPPKSGDVRAGDIVIQTPGGGSGDNAAGCRAQYGTNWGKAGGGVDNSQACANLPQNLQGGCYWRFNWAGGVVNGWGISYTQVSCPSRLTAISGCSA